MGGGSSNICGQGKGRVERGERQGKGRFGGFALEGSLILRLGGVYKRGHLKFLQQGPQKKKTPPLSTPLP